jgi:hypothetical protein
MNEIEKYRKRRDARMKKRMDEEWVTMKGTHVLIDDDGQAKGGPDRVKSLIKESGGYKKGSKKIIEGAPMFNVAPKSMESNAESSSKKWAKNARKAKIINPQIGDIKESDKASTMEEDFEKEGYRKNKEGRWERK